MSSSASRSYARRCIPFGRRPTILAEPTLKLLAAAEQAVPLVLELARVPEPVAVPAEEVPVAEVELPDASAATLGRQRNHGRHRCALTLVESRF